MSITCTQFGYRMTLGGYDDCPYIHTKYELFEGVSVREAAQVGLDDDNDGYHIHNTWESHAHHMSITCTSFGYGMTLWV